MTQYTDEFTSLNTSSWIVGAVTGDSDVSITADTLLSSAVSGGRIRRPIEEFDITGFAAGGSSNPLDLTLGSATTLDVGTQVWCYIAGTDDGGAGLELNGVKLATVLSSTLVSIQNTDGTAFDGTAGSYAVTGTPTVSLPTVFTTSNDEEQRAGGIFHASSEADGNRAVLWCRYGVEKTTLAGYGAALEWGTSGVRTLSILKLNESTGAEETLTSLSVASLMQTQASSDLNVSQFLSVAVTDIQEGEQIADTTPEAAGVLIRVWLNTESDAEVTLEFRDRDRIPHRAAGGFAVELGGTSAVFCDQWMAETGYVTSDYGEHEHNNRTLGELRTVLRRRLGGGNTSNYESAYLDDAINEAIYEIIAEIGDNALFLQKIRNWTLTVDADNLVTMPYYVDRVDAIFDASSHGPVHWQMVGTDDYGRQRIYMDDRPSGRAYDVRFWERVEPLEEDDDVCCVPRRWDDVVLCAAALRVAGEGERDKAHGETLYRRYRTMLGALMKDMNRQRRGEGRRMRVSYRATIASRRRSRYVPDWQLRFPT